MKTWQQLKDDPRSRDRYAARSQVVKAIRDFLWEEGFLEVETPQLVPLPSMEPNLEVFETTLLDEHRQKYRAFLTSSPEFAMKKLLAANLGNMFQICKSYRNQEGWSSRHNPEFTILEWYRTNADYTAIMQDCEKMFRFIAKRLGHPGILRYQGKEYDLNQPWERLTVAQAFQLYAEVEEEDLLDETRLLAMAARKGYRMEAGNTWEEAFNQIFLNEVEPFLGRLQPTILYEYPVAQASLSRKKPSDPRYAERFEFYVAGLELGNAFSELIDAEEQATRLLADREEKEHLGKTLYDVDQDFLEALESGLPETAGIAVGVDRVCMLFLDAETVQETLFFPATELWEKQV